MTRANRSSGLLHCVGGQLPFSRRFEETYRLHLQRYESFHRVITLKMKAVTSIETLGSNYKTTRRNNTEDLPQKENSLETNTIFNSVSFPSRHTNLPVASEFFLSLVTQGKIW